MNLYGDKPKKFRIVFYNGSIIIIEGFNYIDAIQKYGIDVRQVISYSEVWR